MAADKVTERALQKPHTVIIEDRQSMSVTGIIQVEGYNETTVALKTEAGGLVVGGKNLTVSELSTKDGAVKIFGDIVFIQYTEKRDKKKGLFARVMR